MKQNHPSHREVSNADWHILGELDLSFGAEASGTSDVWLAETLIPLKLHADFLNKILRSAQEAIARILHSTRAVDGSEHLHLLIFVPADSSSERHNWGFFRIEKIASTAAAESIPDHVIQFFLYREEG